MAVIPAKLVLRESGGAGIQPLRDWPGPRLRGGDNDADFHSHGWALKTGAKLLVFNVSPDSESFSFREDSLVTPLKHLVSND